MKVKISEIELDKDIYPRQQISRKTVEAYVEALKGGATFPPIEVQRISVDNNGVSEEKIIHLDGLHRLEAYKEYNKVVDNPVKEIEVIHYKDAVLDKGEYLEELRLESANKNILHGDRLDFKDREFQAQRIVRANPKITNKLLAKKFGVTEKTVSLWVSDIRARQNASRDASIYRLNLLGYTYKEIVDILETSEPTIAKTLKDFTLVKNLSEDFYNNKKSIQEITKYYQLDEILTWAIILEGKPDLERFELFGDSKYQDDSPRIYNIWNFTGCDSRLGQEHPGRIPGQIVLNLLYYYTKQGDLVADPMAGGGSTIDACLVMGRKCRAYDIDPKRKDIIKWDLGKGFHEKAKGCNFIFLDPPYWRLKDEFYAEGSISGGSLEEWLSFMENTIKVSYETVCENGYVALIIEPFLDEKVTGNFLDLTFDCVGFFKEVGFKQIERISVPVSSQVKSHRDVGYGKRKKILLDLNRDLVVFRR